MLATLKITFTLARNIGNGDEDIFLTSKSACGFMIEVAGFILGSWSSNLVVVFRKNSMEVVYFFSQDFRSGTKIFHSVN